jgi:hypothetical protein
VQIKSIRPDDLVDNTKFWQTEQRFNTMEIHEQGFLRLDGCVYPEFCGESCACQEAALSL